MSDPQNMTWFCPDRLFDGKRLLTGVALGVSGSRSTVIADVSEMGADAQSVKIKGTLSPGFIDLQVNGGGGVLLNSDPSQSAMAAITEAHRTFGTVAILPTLITDKREKLEMACQAAVEAKGQKGIAGLHIEGPHLSTARRGTHEAGFIHALDDRTIAMVRDLRSHGIPTMITLAPEAATTQQISELAQTGAIVSIGHSDTTAEKTHAAFTAGANCATHLFNAMSPMQNREPGVTGATINSKAYAGIICDGVHVSDEMVGLAFRARPVADRMFLVSDAMPTVGGPDNFDLYGKNIRLRDNNLINSDGSLAGAHTTIAQSLARLVNVVGIDPEQALRAAIHVPSSLMDLGLDRITDRSVDDIVLLDENLEFSRYLSAEI